MRKLPIASLGLITATATAARVTAGDTSFAESLAHADSCTVIGFQWVSGTVYIGDSTVATSGTGCYGVLDTTTRLLRFESTSDTSSLRIQDFWCVNTGTFICYYQCF
jgi:virulence-associated protein VapD